MVGRLVAVGLTLMPEQRTKSSQAQLILRSGDAREKGAGAFPLMGAGTGHGDLTFGGNNVVVASRQCSRRLINRKLNLGASP